MNDYLGIQTLIALGAIAVSMAVLFFVVRGAILSALGEHHRRVERAAARAQVTETHG
jgi:hypothetical protein